MQVEFADPSRGQPSRFEMRIGDYMKALDLDDAGRHSLWARIGSHKLLLGRTVKDVFLDNGTAQRSCGSKGDLWIFTSDSVCRHRDMATDTEFEFIALRDVRSVSLIAHGSNMFSVSPHSQMSMRIAFDGQKAAILSADGTNCLYLLIMFRKYFSRRMAP